MRHKFTSMDFKVKVYLDEIDRTTVSYELGVDYNYMNPMRMELI